MRELPDVAQACPDPSGLEVPVQKELEAPEGTSSFRNGVNLFGWQAGIASLLVFSKTPSAPWKG